MTDAMKYNSKSPDAVSVAAYITRYYAVEKHLSADQLEVIFNDSVKTAEQVLADKTNIDLQKAMDLVEQARTGAAYAKFVPRPSDLKQSIVAREETRTVATVSDDALPKEEEKWIIKRIDKMLIERDAKNIPRKISSNFPRKMSLNFPRKMSSQLPDSLYKPKRTRDVTEIPLKRRLSVE